MISKSEALELVARMLKESSTDSVEYVVVDEHTIEKTYGWFFFYNSKKFIETGEFIHRLAGNGPVFVNKTTGETKRFGSLPPLDELIAQLESELGDDGCVPGHSDIMPTVA